MCFFIQRRVDASDAYNELSKSGLLLRSWRRGLLGLGIAWVGRGYLAIRLSICILPSMIWSVGKSLIEG